MGFEIGGKWPYSSYFVGFCLQDLFTIACSILVKFLWCLHTVISIQPQLGRNPVVFYCIDQTSI